MTINEHLTTFAGKPVVDWDPETGLTDPQATIPRLRVEYDADVLWSDEFSKLLEDPQASQLFGIVIGSWGGIDEGQSGDTAEEVVQTLVAARDRLPDLRAIFFGDVTYEETEISWLRQTDVAPIFEAYPLLEHFGVRGGTDLVLGSPRHNHLKSLIVQTGGLDRSILQAILNAQYPALEHLELWLGTDDYGANIGVEDLQPILEGKLFPRLRYLGLRDSYLADEIAVAVAQSPVLEQIKALDLSLGTLGDKGARALAASPAIKNLEKLDIHHHYCSDEVVAELQALGIEVDAGDRQDADEYDGVFHRYVAVGE